MSDLYRQLIEATIQHLEVLKAEGRRFLVLTPDKLAALQAAGQRRRARLTQTPNVKAAPLNRAAAPTLSRNAASHPPLAPSLAPLTPGSTLHPEAKATAMESCVSGHWFV